jgi:glucan endo-1,3-alpha-glucosidase
MLMAAAVSPWFNTHYGGDTFNKNWIFYSDWLFQSRWDQALQLKPQFIEILTWNGTHFAICSFFFS